MIRGFDHLVIACPDPDQAAGALESAIGLAATGGGRHAGRGSWNRIVWLADGTYLELLGIDDPETAARFPVGAAAVRALEAGGGLATYALLVDDLDATVTGLKAAGASFGPSVHGSRTRDDGELVEWWTSVPDRQLSPDAVPFLIQHAYNGAEWGTQALDQRRTFAHPLGGPVRLHGLDIRANDVPSSASALHDQLQVDFWAAGDIAVAEIGPHVFRQVPPHHLQQPAAITLVAEGTERRSADVLGLRFVIEPGVTSGTG